MLRTHRRRRIILSHGGGTLPYTANRIARLSEEFQLMDKSAEDLLEETRGFYFDITFTGYREPIELLLKFAHPGHVMYGSDYPFGRGETITAQLRNVDRRWCISQARCCTKTSSSISRCKMTILNLIGVDL